MSRISNIDWYRHLSFAAVGGFFAAYAILLRMGIMANAQTLNLLDILLNSFEGDWLGVLMHIGALVIYIVGTMSTVFLPRLFGWDMRRVSPAVDALCAVVLAFLPAETPTIPALYPIFFAMSVQWSSFSGAQGNVREKGQLRRMWFYVSTILSFHIGAASAYFAVELWEIKASLCALPFILWAYFMVVCEDRYCREHESAPA